MVGVLTLVGTGRDDISMQFASRDFPLGGCEAAPCVLMVKLMIKVLKNVSISNLYKFL